MRTSKLSEIEPAGTGGWLRCGRPIGLKNRRKGGALRLALGFGEIVQFFVRQEIGQPLDPLRVAEQLSKARAPRSKAGCAHGSGFKSGFTAPATDARSVRQSLLWRHEPRTGRAEPASWLPEHRRHATPTESDRCTDAQGTGRLVADAGQPALGCLDRFQCTDDVHQHPRALLGRAERAGRAMDQTHAGAAFHCAQAFADHSQRHAFILNCDARKYRIVAGLSRRRQGWILGP
jgi:hypothetical protein